MRWNVNTKHRIINCNSKNTQDYIRDKTVGLVVTSPPYPMIEMWDKVMAKQNPKIKSALEDNNGDLAFE